MVPNGEWRNGALTFQIVDASIGKHDIQANVAGKPELGYRLKTSSLDSKLIAEYTTFWHHPNDKCMGDTGWKKDPAQDPINDAIPANHPLVQSDPKFGTFGINPIQLGLAGTTNTVVTTVNNTNGTTTTTTVVTTIVTNADGSTNTTVKTTNLQHPLQPMAIQVLIRVVLLIRAEVLILMERIPEQKQQRLVVLTGANYNDDESNNIDNVCVKINLALH